MNREQAETYDTLLRSRGFMVYLHECVLPLMREWQRELLTNLTLSLDERLGKQQALAAMQEGIKQAYEKGGQELPSWLKKELMLE